MFLIRLLAVAGALMALAGPSFAQDHALRLWRPVGEPDVEAQYVRSGGGYVTLKRPDGQTLRVAVENLTPDGRRYAANAEAVERPFRTWTLKPGAYVKEARPEHAEDFDENGTSRRFLLLPETFEGSFLKVAGSGAHLFVVVVRDDYEQRAYPAFHLSDEDLAYVAKEWSPPARPASRVSLTGNPFDPAGEGATVEETAHFAFLYGDGRSEDPVTISLLRQAAAAGRTLQNADYRQAVFSDFEDMWAFYEFEEQVPALPFEGAPAAPKIGVRVTRTGLPGAQDLGGAEHGPATLQVPLPDFHPGSPETARLFSYCLQDHLGGFPGMACAEWFRDCHAGWSERQRVRIAAPGLERYTAAGHLELDASRNRFGSWLFLQAISETPDLDDVLVWDVWRRNRKGRFGQSAEDPIQALMRLAFERGAFPDPAGGFADLIGDMASRNVVWDYADQHLFLKQGVSQWAWLRPLPEKPGWFRPFVSQTPRDYGWNIMHLTPEAGATEIKVRFRGFVDETARSEWRAVLLIWDADLRTRYSRMLRGVEGEISLERRDGEDFAALVVAATPAHYRPTARRAGYGQKARHFYEAAFEGCAPAPRLEQHDTAGLRGGPHTFGGGFVAAGARVAPTAYVGPTAAVLGGAVLDQARIEDFAVVHDGIVRGTAQVRTGAQIRGGIIEGAAVVGGKAVVERGARVGGRARVLEFATLRAAEGAREGRVEGHALVTGFAEVEIAADAPVAGETIVGEGCFLNTSGFGRPVAGGMLAGSVDADVLRTTADNQGLYAHWDAEWAKRGFLKDANGDCDAILRGAPEFGGEGGRSWIAFNGEDQFATLEGQVMETEDLCVDALVWWEGGETPQCLFEFGGASGRVSFFVRGDSGVPEFVLFSGDRVERLSLDEAFPQGRWTRLTIMLHGEEAALFIDGRPAAQGRIALDPAGLRPTYGALAATLESGKLFHGRIDDLKVFRRAFPNVQAIPDMWWYKGRTGVWRRDFATGVSAQSDATAADAQAVLVRNWRDVVFSTRARRTAGAGEIRLLFRVDELDGASCRYEWRIGDGRSRLLRFAPGEEVLEEREIPQLDPGAEHLLEATVCASEFDCVLDGETLHQVEDDLLQYGGVGVGTAGAAAEFRDLRIEPAAVRLRAATPRLALSHAGDVGNGRIVLEHPDPAAELFFTIDGTEPTRASRPVRGALPLMPTVENLKVRAYCQEGAPSRVALFRQHAPDHEDVRMGMLGLLLHGGGEDVSAARSVDALAPESASGAAGPVVFEGFLHVEEAGLHVFEVARGAGCSAAALTIGGERMENVSTAARAVRRALILRPGLYALRFEANLESAAPEAFAVRFQRPTAEDLAPIPELRLRHKRP